MVETLRKHPVDEHASNLGAVLAYDLAEPLGIPAYIYDAVVTDEMDDVARFSGVPELPRRASCHVLNMYAAARKYAERTSRPPEETTVVIMHMGGGISGCALLQGRMIDVLSDEEGPFSPERAGRVPCRQLVNLCFSGRLDHSAATRRMRGNGGLRAYLGTGSVLEVERRIAAGDAYAAQVYEAMAYQVAKGIGELATVLPGGPEAIILTGAIARSQTFTQLITNRVRFLAQVVIIPGENEMEALALGAPIALAKASCLPELYGDTARYFDPYDYEVDLDALAARPVAPPDKVLAKYSWDKTADFWLHEIEKYAKQ